MDVFSMSQQDFQNLANSSKPVPWKPTSPYDFDPNNPDPAHAPLYTPTYNAATMATAPGFQKQLDYLNLDKSALNQFQGEAMRQGPSKYATLANRQQNQESMNARDRGAGEVAGQGATARASLATRGGLTGGAAERIAQGGQNNFLNMNQSINQDLAKNKLQISTNDETNRIQQLGSVPGMQYQTADFDLNKLKAGQTATQFDIGNQITANQNQNQFNLGRYGAQMGAWGADKQAQATGSAGKK